LCGEITMLGVKTKKNVTGGEGEIWRPAGKSR
jgi:hypothetical protein